MVTANTIRSIRPPKPDASKKSITTSLFDVLDEIDAKLAEPGITQKMVAEALGINQKSFGVLLARARDKKATAAFKASGGGPDAKPYK